MRINPADSVEINLETGHKYAVKEIQTGENVIKYGFPIGHATQLIQKGELVHSHNLKTNLGEVLSYSYHPHPYPMPSVEADRTFLGYRRPDGTVGIRNEIWIINTVGCVNKIGEEIARRTGAECFTHPFGCSQLGDDLEVTQKTLRGLVRHPNAGGVLVLGLGCENNNIASFQKVLGEYDTTRVKFLNAQDAENEIDEGVRLVGELRQYADTFIRTPVPVSELKIGLKCGGSDGFSGITANPLVGHVSDLLIAAGGTAVLTEVPEMFGAETLLMERCESREVFDRTVDLINQFKEYFVRHNQVIYENPSPGNKEGGITTLEEKSLGCVQKGGKAIITDVLDYGDSLCKKGLNLLNGPGNDIVAVTNLTACGAHLILFTTGRGTPLGAPVPTIKISSNSALYHRKPGWIDFNAGDLLDGQTMEQLSLKLFGECIAVAEGKLTKNEQNHCKEIAILKDGVTL